MLDRLRRFYRQHAFRKETYYLLNHFTLTVSNPEIQREVEKHHAQQITRITKPWCVIEILVFLGIFYEFINYGGKTNSLMMQQALSLAIVVGISLLLWCGKHHRVKYLFYLLFAG